MKIDNTLLDELTAQAQASPRLRMNMDLRNSAADTSQMADFVGDNFGIVRLILTFV